MASVPIAGTALPTNGAPLVRPLADAQRFGSSARQLTIRA